MFMTPTARLADYVLPAAFWPELDHVSELPAFAPMAVLAQHRAVSVGEARPDEEILTDLARRLNLPGSDITPADMIAERLRPTGLSLEQLREQPTIAIACERGHRRGHGFDTPSRKVELHSRALARLGLDPLPTYRAPSEGALPLTLTTGMRRPQYFHSEGRQVGGLRRRRDAAVAEMHPDTARTYGVAHGEMVCVCSEHGRIAVRAHVTRDIADGVVAVEHGWWSPERASDPDSVWSANANVLTSNGPPYDPAFGSYALRGLPCTLERYEPEATT
jgi:anaerobic selenocysteine-containing dehydrogenase